MSSLKSLYLAYPRIVPTADDLRLGRQHHMKVEQAGQRKPYMQHLDLQPDKFKILPRCDHLDESNLSSKALLLSRYLHPRQLECLQASIFRLRRLVCM